MRTTARRGSQALTRALPSIGVYTLPPIRFGERAKMLQLVAVVAVGEK